MSDQDWRFPVSQIVYGLIFAPRLDEQLARRCAADILERRSLREGPEAYYRAIPAALASDNQLSKLHDISHSEVELRDFLVRVQQALDALRPWQQPLVSRLDIARWPEFAAARAIGRINATRMGVTARLRERFGRIPGGADILNVLLVRLATGEELALLAPAERTERGVLILAKEPLDAAQTLRHFAAATGFDDTDVASID